MKYNFHYEVRSPLYSRTQIKSSSIWRDGMGLVRAPTEKKARSKARAAVRAEHESDWRISLLELDDINTSYIAEIENELNPTQVRRYQEEGVVIYESGT